MEQKPIEPMTAQAGSPASYLTLRDIEGLIISEHFFTADGGARDTEALNIGLDGSAPDKALPTYALRLVTFCVLVLRNGAKVVGINYGPVDPANFDAAYARKAARLDAVEKIWPLEGYLLRALLAAEPVARVVDNNQPGWRVVADTAPAVTLPIGTRLFRDVDLRG